MPEISIGLFPDVGGTWMLSHLPAGIGHFLALSGAQINASDCLFLGLADAYLPRVHFDALLKALQATNWSDERDARDSSVHQVLRGLAEGARPDTGPLEQKLRHAA